MSAYRLSDLLWYYTVLCGWSSMIAVALATYARYRFRACLRASASHSIGGSDMWEEMYTFWNTSGLAMAGVSILCCGLWLAV
jgi:hypothetical protein